jgi:hypothetical protein
MTATMMAKFMKVEQVLVSYSKIILATEEFGKVHVVGYCSNVCKHGVLLVVFLIHKSIAETIKIHFGCYFF